MHNEHLRFWQHGHSFGQEKKRPGEIRTIIVIAITGMMMIVEVSAGIVFGSMALLADGLHMASHAAALSVSAFAYVYARRHAHDERYSFGTGKVNSLGGYTGAVLLAVFALIMAWESVKRFIYPIDIAFNQAALKFTNTLTKMKWTRCNHDVKGLRKMLVELKNWKNRCVQSEMKLRLCCAELPLRDAMSRR